MVGEGGEVVGRGRRGMVEEGRERGSWWVMVGGGGEGRGGNLGG